MKTLEIIFFLILFVALFYRKYGGRFTLPKFDATDKKVPDFVTKWWGELNPGQRKFVWLTFILLVATAGMFSSLNGWTVLHIVEALVIIGLFVSPPKKADTANSLTIAAIFLVTFASLLPGIQSFATAKWAMLEMWTNETGWQTIMKAKAYEQEDIAFDSKSETKTQLITRAPQLYQPETRVVEVIATNEGFKEVQIPKMARFAWDCPSGGLVAVVHDGVPQGIIYDCDHDVEVGENLHHLRLGFSSKTGTPVRVTVRITS